MRYGTAVVVEDELFLRSRPKSISGREGATMAPKAVKDVHPETFIKAYAAHLKANDKVGNA